MASANALASIAPMPTQEERFRVAGGDQSGDCGADRPAAARSACPIAGSRPGPSCRPYGTGWKGAHRQPASKTVTFSISTAISRGRRRTALSGARRKPSPTSMLRSSCATRRVFTLVRQAERHQRLSAPDIGPPRHRRLSRDAQHGRASARPVGGAVRGRMRRAAVDDLFGVPSDQPNPRAGPVAHTQARIAPQARSNRVLTRRLPVKACAASPVSPVSGSSICHIRQKRPRSARRDCDAKQLGTALWCSGRSLGDP